MFSFKERETVWTQASQRHWDVAIIGGGAVGCSVAAHAARAGLSCILIERQDIASGASGNSTGLAHAGLRYLAQGHILYVFHETRERRRLQGLAPHWVRPFDFILPVYERDRYSMPWVRLGTAVYDAMTRFDAWRTGAPSPRLARHLSTQEVCERVPGLSAKGLQGGTEYFVDAQLQDSRFALGFAQTAHALGASVLTHARVDGVAEVDAAMRLVVRDLLRDRTCQLGAKLVVNAAGAWIDELRGARAKEKPLVEPSQGIHLVVDRIAEVPLIFSLPVDGRVFFVLPYGRDASLVGTTDTPIVGPPDAARPTRRDVNEILSYLFRFFPRLAEEKEYTTRHVRDVYWGLRPLLRHGGKAARASREHAVVRESAAWWSVPGVKLTAARAVGEEVALKAVEALRRERLPEIDLGSLPGGDIQDYDEFLEQSVNELVAAGLGADTASYLTRTYGTRATSVMERAKADAALARRVLPDEPWIYAQAAYAVDEEMVLTLNDLLWRRTKWAHYRQLPPDVIARLAQLLGERLAWAPAQRSSEIEAYDLEWSRHRFPIPG